MTLLYARVIGIEMPGLEHVVGIGFDTPGTRPSREVLLYFDPRAFSAAENEEILQARQAAGILNDWRRRVLEDHHDEYPDAPNI